MIGKELEFQVNIESIQIGKLTTKVRLGIFVLNIIYCSNFSSSSSNSKKLRSQMMPKKESKHNRNSSFLLSWRDKKKPTGHLRPFRNTNLVTRYHSSIRRVSMSSASNNSASSYWQNLKEVKITQMLNQSNWPSIRSECSLLPSVRCTTESN